MDSLPFMVTVIAQSSARVLYQNGPSKAYHGAYDPETSGTGDDLLRNLFSMSQASDRDQLLKVCWTTVQYHAYTGEYTGMDTVMHRFVNYNLELSPFSEHCGS